jgi:hypothetical protein
MKRSYRFTTSDREKSKKQKKSTKAVSSAVIARRYLELQRLRQEVSDAQLRLSTR